MKWRRAIVTLLGGQTPEATFVPIKVDPEGRIYVILDDQLGIFPIDAGGNFKVNAGQAYSVPQEPETIQLTTETPEDSYELSSPGEPVKVMFAAFGEGDSFQVNFDNQTNFMTLPTFTTFIFHLINVEQINFKMDDLPVSISVMEFSEEVVR